MRKPSPELKAYAMLGLVMLLWAGNSIVGRAIRDEIPPFTLAFVRWAGAVLVLLPFAARQVMAERRAILRVWRPVLVLGLTGVAAFNGFLYSGLHSTTASNALLLQAGIPALVLVADLSLFRVRPGRAAIIGVAVSTLGVVAIVFRGDPAVVRTLHFNRGDLLVMCGVVAWALYTTLLKTRPAIPGLSLLTVTFAVGALAMLPLAATEWREIAAMRFTPAVIAAFVYVAIFPSIIGYFLFNAAVATLGPARPGQAISLMPLFGALLAAPLLGERLHGYHLAGMALILAGIAATALLGRTRRVGVRTDPSATG